MTYDEAASYCINMGMHSARSLAIIAEPTNSLIQERLKLFASNMKLGKGSFKNHVDIILLIFDHPPTSVDTFYVLNVDKNGKF